MYLSLGESELKKGCRRNHKVTGSAFRLAYNVVGKLQALPRLSPQNDAVTITVHELRQVRLCIEKTSEYGVELWVCRKQWS